MYLDADVLYAFLKPSDRHLDFAEEIIGLKEEELYTSVMSVVEVEFVVKRELNDFLAKTVLQAILEKIPKLTIVSFDRKVLEKSFEFQKEFGFGIFDSIHAATAFFKDQKIASTDHIYDKIPSLKRIKPAMD